MMPLYVLGCCVCKQLRGLYWMGQKYVASTNISPERVGSILEWLQVERVKIARDVRIAYEATQTAALTSNTEGFRIKGVATLGKSEVAANGQQVNILNQVIDLALDMYGLKKLMV